MTTDLFDRDFVTNEFACEQGDYIHIGGLVSVEVLSVTDTCVNLAIHTEDGDSNRTIVRTISMDRSETTLDD